MTHEWKIEPGSSRPDPTAMLDFNVLTFNSKAFPGTEPLVVGRNERVRIRFGNLSAMDHHPIHLHGYNFNVTQTDGGYVPPAAQAFDRACSHSHAQDRAGAPRRPGPGWEIARSVVTFTGPAA